LSDPAAEALEAGPSADPSGDLLPTRSPDAAPPPIASSLTRFGAWLVDHLLLLVLLLPAAAGAQAYVDRITDPGRPLGIPVEVSVGFGLATGAFFLLQWVLQAFSGATLGGRMAGLQVVRTDGDRPGFLRGVVLRGWLPTLLVSAVFAWLFSAWVPSPGVQRFIETGGDVPPWLATLRQLPLGYFAYLVLDALLVLFARRRRLGGRLSGTQVTVRGDADGRAFQPARFSGPGMGAAFIGIACTALLAGLVWTVLSGRADFESTDLDLPALVASAVGVLGLVAAGAFGAFAARRFLVGELAFLALLVALVVFELEATRLVLVPALQRFEIAGWLDWSVYAICLYFGLVLFLVIGSAIGFMVSSDEGLDVSTRFERLVARRHLRLKLSHWALLAFIATLAPVLIYGVFVWPVRTALRLVQGRAVGRPLPPTVFMALLTIVGVMFGVTSLTVVLAVMGGFERDLKEKILGTNAHGVIHRYVGEFTEWQEVSRKVRAVPGVSGVTPFILSEVMITTDSAVSGAVLKGIDVETVGQVTELEKNIEPGSGRLRDLVYPDRIPRGSGFDPKKHGDDDERAAAERGEPRPDLPPPPDAAVGEDDDEVLPGLVVGREMARSLRVWIGDRVTVMNPLGELGPQGPIPRSRTFRIAAVFYSGMYEYDSKFAYIQLREAQRFFRLGDSVTGLELRFNNVDEARPLMKRISGVLSGFPYKTKDWGEMNKNLFSALRLERVVMFVLLSFQVLIACICVIATLVMLVVEKRKEVATLKAMGAREASIMKLFTIEGLIIGAIGTFYGATAGYLFCRIVDGIKLDPEVYYIESLPVRIDPLSFVAVAAVAMVLVFVATIYPARRGGSIAPVEGFREE
jgi:lipoprotein-releasing system permease protein